MVAIGEPHPRKLRYIMTAGISKPLYLYFFVVRRLLAIMKGLNYHIPPPPSQ